MHESVETFCLSPLTLWVVVIGDVSSFDPVPGDEFGDRSGAISVATVSYYHNLLCFPTVLIVKYSFWVCHLISPIRKENGYDYDGGNDRRQAQAAQARKGVDASPASRRIRRQPEHHRPNRERRPAHSTPRNARQTC